MTNLIQKADKFAEHWFVKQDQRRKYTNDPYMVHPREVAEIIKSVPHDENMICAALLHDTVEDTPVKIEQIYDEFNQDIGDLVGWLTDVSKASDGNRKMRKAIDRAHTARAPAKAQTIKLGDLISNSKSIVALDPKFAAVYIPEKQLVLEVLTKGDKTLRKQAQQIIDEYFDLKVGAVVAYETAKDSEVGIITELNPATNNSHGSITVLYPDGVPAMRSKRTGKIYNKPKYWVEHYVHNPRSFRKMDVDVINWDRQKWRELRQKINSLDQSDGQVQLAQEELINLHVQVILQKSHIKHNEDIPGIDMSDRTPEEWQELEQDLIEMEEQSEEIGKAAQKLRDNLKACINGH